MSIFDITKEQSQANVKASESALKVGIRAVESGLSSHIKDVVIHSVAHNCPHVCANLVQLLDDEGMSKQLKATKSFLNKFTAASLKGDTPTLDAKRKEALDREAIATALDTMQELGIMGWYAEQTGSKKPKTEKTEAQKLAAKQDKAFKALLECAENNLVLRQALDYVRKVQELAETNEGMALDMVQADLRKMVGGIQSAIVNAKQAA